MIETCVKIWNAWQVRSAITGRIAGFNSAWGALMICLNQEPRAVMTSSLMWDLFLTVKVSDPNSTAMPELTTRNMESRMGHLGQDGIITLQFKFVRVKIGNILNTEEKPEVVQGTLSMCLSDFFSCNDYPDSLTIQVESLRSLVDAKPLVANHSTHVQLKSAVTLLDPAHGTQDDHLVVLLKRFKVQGVTSKCRGT